MPAKDVRVALIGPIPPPAGGMANQTRQLKELLTQEGLQVELVPVNPPYPAWVAERTGLRAVVRLLQYLPALWRAAGRNDVFHIMANSGWSWHLFAVPAVWIAKLRGVPALVNYRGGEAAQFLEQSGAKVLATLRRAAALVVPSGYLKQVFGPHGIPARVIPNIVNTQRFHPAPDRVRDPEAPHVVVTRNLEPIYGIDVAVLAFVQIARAFPGARMSIAGSGPERARLEQAVKSAGLTQKVKFLGRLDPVQTADLYRQADVFLNPSHVDNMPNSVLEAWASGVPVVTTCVGGVPFMAHDEVDALFAPPGDAPALAACVLRILRDPALSARLSSAGQAMAQQHTWEQVGASWLGLYAELGRGTTHTHTPRTPNSLPKP